jgi:hypothetical protein
MSKSVAPCLDVHEGHARDDEYPAEELGGAEALTLQRNGHRGGEQGYEVQEDPPRAAPILPIPAFQQRKAATEATMPT